VEGHWLVAGNEIFNPIDHLRRYCGLSWSGGLPEAWAFQYFDEIPLTGGPDRLSPTDVLACGSLLPQIQPRWFSWLFEEGLNEISNWAREVPRHSDLSEASSDELFEVFTLEKFNKNIPLSLTSKLAHRLRPRLVPMYDATIGKRYDLAHGVRGTKGWSHFVEAFANDLQRNEGSLRYASEHVSLELGKVSSHRYESRFRARDWREEPLAMTRILDIVIYVDDELRRRANPVRRKQLPPRPPIR
jgi:hypothetical protein